MLFLCLAVLVGLAAANPPRIIFDCTGADGVLWFACGAYGLCRGGQYSQIDCVNGTVYNQDAQQCTQRDNRVPPPCNRPIPNCAQFISPDFPVRRIADREPDPQRNRPPCSFYFTCANSTFMGYQLCPPGKTFTGLCPPVQMRRLVLFARCLVPSSFHKQSQSAEDGKGGRGVVVMVGTVYDEQDMRCERPERVPPDCGTGPQRPTPAPIIFSITDRNNNGRGPLNSGTNTPYQPPNSGNPTFPYQPPNSGNPNFPYQPPNSGNPNNPYQPPSGGTAKPMPNYGVDPWYYLRFRRY
ncbi:hypothetical protein C0Q70_06985 [Pomacea canaliculata]|uniref:Chitin-binding type-2 domain-containing protein n=1 Tax=Pomacea canaliculata TaxID=400727 RepID=A0A2T7PDT1_POMCA|nr:hypothetical protein C0Q70_06985 [Pomacea canaliculata]